MNKFIPFEKLSKKEKKKLNQKKRAEGFGVDMRMKVIPDKTKYQRHPKHKNKEE